MIETIELLPGVILRCYTDSRFKQGCLSFQIVRSMTNEEAALNALLPAVLLRGCRQYPDLRAITNRLDELYGASVGALVRRVGDYQTTGLHCGFMEDRFALDGDAIFVPMVQLLRQLLVEPILEGDAFCREFVESEKKNLIATIEAERNDKRAYAASRLMRLMCKEDSFGIPRLGRKKQVAEITPESLYAHYRKILETSVVNLFYVGSCEAAQVADMVRPLLEGISRKPLMLPEQTPFHPCPPSENEEEMDVTQAKLCMGFVTPITNQSTDYPAMQVLNMVFGGGMTSKLFVNVREKLSLCYSIGSGYHGSKGIMTVSAGIDTEQCQRTKDEIMAQLDCCCRGEITEEELISAKEAILSSLRSVTDTPGAIENFYITSTLSGMPFEIPEYMAAVAAVTIEDVAKVARTIRLHTSFFLKGVGA